MLPAMNSPPSANLRSPSKAAIPEKGKEACVEAWKLSPVAPEMTALRKQHGLQPIAVRPTTEAAIHPGHNFTWATSKLFCKTHEGQCAICRSHCCAHEELAQSVRCSNPAAGQSATSKALDSLNLCGGNGVESYNTMLHCTECARVVCPRCAGRCPVALCRDITCKHCVPDPVADCPNH